MFERLKNSTSIALIALALAGCDGTIGFSDPVESFKQMPVRMLARGAAGKLELVNEDPDKTKTRRATLEMLLEKSGADMEKTVADVLVDNALNSTVDISAANIGSPTQINVRYVTNLDAVVDMSFIVEQAVIAKFLHITKIPIFDTARVSIGDKVLPIKPLDVFVRTFNKNPEAMTVAIKDALSVIEKKEKAAAERLARLEDGKLKCETQVNEKYAEAEPNPGLSDLRKNLFYEQLQSQIAQETEGCVLKLKAELQREAAAAFKGDGR